MWGTMPRHNALVHASFVGGCQPTKQTKIVGRGEKGFRGAEEKETSRRGAVASVRKSGNGTARNGRAGNQNIKKRAEAGVAFE